MKTTKANLVLDAIRSKKLTVLKVVKETDNGIVDIPVEKFIESLEFLTETIFMDTLDWRYKQRNHEVVLNIGKMSTYSESYIVVMNHNIDENMVDSALKYVDIVA